VASRVEDTKKDEKDVSTLKTMVNIKFTGIS
jgi:hypothetical protein